MDNSIEYSTSFSKDFDRIYLWGLAGVGKSTLGKKIAKLLHLPFIDLDVEIEKQENLSVAQIFELHGEAYFRKCEAQTLIRVSSLNAVISTGGGTPCYFKNTTLMVQSGLCVYLKASPKFAASRLYHAKKVRPLVAKANSLEELENMISAQLSGRDKFYEQAHVIVEALNLNAEKLLELMKDV